MRRSSFLLALLTIPFAPASASAHRVDFECRQRGDKVEVEAFYDDDTPAFKAKVQVADVQEQIIVEGTTDEKGCWSFAAPAPGKYEIRLDAGAGHRARHFITIAPKAEISSADTPTPTPTVLSDGAKRADVTGTPWLKILLGLAVIGACSGAFLLANRLRLNGRQH